MNISKLILPLLLVLLISSCSKEDMKVAELSDVKLSGVSLKCAIKGSENNSKNKTANVAYDRGDAPVYISGVTLTVENLEYDVEDVIKKFNFTDDEYSSSSNIDIQEIVLNNLTVGENRITAVGICKNEPLNRYYKNIEKFDASTLKARANQYADYLVQLQPLHADYTGEKPLIKEISPDMDDNTVDIVMTTESHRLAVVVENAEDSEYLLKVSIETEGGEVLLSSSGLMGIDTQAAFVVNDDDAYGAKNYNLKIRCFTKKSETEIKDMTIVRPIAAQSRDNITKLYHFSKDELYTSSSDVSFTWNVMKENNSGEYIQ